MNRAVGILLLSVLLGFSPAAGTEQPVQPLRILPLGDSITRGTYLARYESGVRQGQAVGLPNPDGGGWRKLLQDHLRAVGAAFDFVGELNYHSYGRDGVIDAAFDPDHHGLAGFGNRQIISGGKVPTLPDVLESIGKTEVVVPDLVTVLRKHRPEVILLLSGARRIDPSDQRELSGAFVCRHDSAATCAACGLGKSRYLQFKPAGHRGTATGRRISCHTGGSASGVERR